MNSFNICAALIGFGVSFDRPWLLLLIIPAAALILLPYLKMPKFRKRTFKHTAPLVTHLVVAVLLTLIMSGMVFVDNSETNAVMILCDLSDSTERVRQEMTEFIRDSAKYKDRSTELGLTVFAGESLYSAEIGANLAKAELTEAPLTSVTNIAAALDYTASLLPSDCNRRVILLTDGQQTDGDAVLSASALSAQGIRVDAVYFDTNGADGAEVQLKSVEMPAAVYAGDTFRIDISVESSSYAYGQIKLYEGETEISSLDAELYAGSNSFTMFAAADGEGAKIYSVAVEGADDTVAQNNRVYAYLNVAQNPHILIIANSTTEAKPLGDLLKADYSVTVKTPAKAPTDLTGLCDYDGVILLNADNDDLPKGLDLALSEYAQLYGRGIMTVGGTGTYIYGGMLDSEFENFLPVSIEATDKENAKKLAMVIILDRSSSMSGSPIQMAKQGAIKSVGALASNSYVGVIAFASEAKVICPLTDIAERDTVTKAISRVTTSYGTMLNEAVKSAYDMLKDFDAEIKHVIIMSDGNPGDSGYNLVVEQMLEEGITTSTIALGEGVNTALMKKLSELGGGRYYNVRSAKDLPDIMLGETVESQVDYLCVGDFTPVKGDFTEVLSGVGELPILGGYIGTSLKEGADCVLKTPEGRPIYASWKWGEGKVASFMSDIGGDWSKAFMADENGKLFILNAVKSVLPAVHSDSSIRLTTDGGGGTTVITATTAAKSDSQTVSINITTPDGRYLARGMRTVEPGTYEYTLDTLESGVYGVKLTLLDRGDEIDTLESAVIRSYSSEYDEFALESTELLTEIVEATGGKLYPDALTLMSVIPDPADITRDPTVIMAVIAAILILADIAIRKLRLKDITQYLPKRSG